MAKLPLAKPLFQASSNCLTFPVRPDRIALTAVSHACLTAGLLS